MVKILYIAGKGRSGSTVLDTVLGELDGFFAAGEVFYLWDLGLAKGYLCGCGRPVSECELWSRVVATALEGDGSDDTNPEEVLSWYQDIFRWRRMPRLLRARRAAGSRWTSLEGYTRVVSRLYRAVAEATGARVIIDSSKWATDPVLLGLVPGVEAYCVHLVRDPRAVVYSWKRRRALPDGRVVMPRYPYAYSVLSWLARNLVIERVRRHLPPDRYMRLRYEDFVAQPREWLGAITRFVGEPEGSLSFLEGNTVLLGPNHTAFGNPSRFTTGRLELREDDEWKGRLRPVGQGIVTLAALPLLGRYGYPLRPGKRAEIGV